MNKKTLFFSLLSVFIGSLIFGYSLVFSVFSNSIEIHYTLTTNIYTDTSDLNKTKLVFQSSANLQEYTLTSQCNIYSKFLGKQKSLYLYEVEFLDSDCYNKSVSLVDGDNLVVATQKFKVMSKFDIYDQILDYDDKTLHQLLQSLEEKITQYSKYYSYDTSSGGEYNTFLQKNRKLEELIYNRNIVSNILNKRALGYISPVAGYSIPTTKNKIPNTGRPYRSSYTDGIHHGWDIGSKFGEQVRALDDGIVVRVVSNFQYSDLKAMNYGENLTDDQKGKNLDILRGNQVWIKTSKGDVAFYSHLDEVFAGVKEGTVVRSGDPIGTIGITGVPDKDYTDYHLHFAIHKNPYNHVRAGKYTMEDYMNWPWYFKGESPEVVLEGQKHIFQ